MAYACNWDDFELELNSKLEQVLQNEVTKDVAEKIVDQVYEQVYDAYPPPEYPKYYERRYGDQGLGDVNEVEAEVIDKNTVNIRDRAETKVRSNRELDDLIVNGYGDMAKVWNSPRDIYGSTIEILENSDTIVNAVKKGLKNQGVEII